MTHHSRPQAPLSISIVGVMLVAVLASLVRAFAPASGGATVLGLLALVAVCGLGAIIWRPRLPLVVGHFATAGVALLAVLLICGFVLAIVRVDLSTRSTSLYLAAVALLMGLVALTRARQQELIENSLTVDSINAKVPHELEDALHFTATATAPPGTERSRAAAVGAGLVVAFFAAAAIVLSLVSAEKATDREAFVALSTVSTPAEAGNRTLKIEVSNKRETQTRYRLVISGDAVDRESDIDVAQDTTRAFRISVPAKATVTVKLYRSDRPNSVYRQTVSRPSAA